MRHSADRPAPDTGGGAEPIDYSDRNLTLDAAEDRWAWRARLRANPHSLRIYRGAVFAVGLVVVVVGLIAVPAPGPGWLIVLGGVAVWASEFEFAQRLLDWGGARLHVWTTWMAASPWWVKVSVSLGTMAAVAAGVWALFAVTAVPGFLPDTVDAWLRSLPGIE
ncbi:MAG TPA: TIGR02611 family protein [Candidatus Lustribacter sp.]|nr:TIGR02611 family protein [Candidatus Lustribacter sp.]